LAIDLAGQGIKLPPFITPGLAFVVWVLGAYTYCAFLHTHWEKNREGKTYSADFGRFLTQDLISRFRNPPILFPALVFVLSFFWILYLADSSRMLFGTGVFVLLAGVLWLVYEVSSIAEQGPSKKFKQSVDKDWEFFEKQLDSKLSRRQWIDFLDLEDIAKVWDAPIDRIDDMSYVLAKYAVEHLDTVAYAHVFRRDTEDCVSGQEKVLVNLERLDREKYYF